MKKRNGGHLKLILMWTLPFLLKGCENDCGNFDDTR